MKLIECALEGMSEEEVEQKARKIQRLKWTFMFMLMLVVGPLYAASETIFVDFKSIYNINKILADSLAIMARLIKFSMDLYVFYELYRLIWVFLKIKLSLMKNRGEKLTFRIVLAIIIIYLIISLNCFQAAAWQAIPFLQWIMGDSTYS